MFINWLKLIYPINKDIFHVELEKINANCVDLGHEKCCKCMVKAIAKAVKEVKTTEKVYLRKVHT